MKKFIKEAIIFLIVIFVATNVVGYYRSLDVKTNNINLLSSYSTIDNKNIKDILSSKKVLVLNFWGTWCPVCNQEVSTLSKLAKRDDITLLTIAVNSGSNEDIKRYMKDKNINFLVINDSSGTLAKKFNISVFPTTIFYSKDLKSSIKDSGYTTTAGFLARVKYMENR